MGSTGSNLQIVIDWAEVEDLDALYDSLFAQTGAPSWHGRNLNAINDSWVTGSICSEGPPFDFVLRNEDHAKPGLEEAAKAIREIAEESARENTGSVRPSPMGTTRRH